MNEEIQQLKILVIGPDSPHVNTFVMRLLALGHRVEVISSGKKHIDFTPVHYADFSLVRVANFFKTPPIIRRVASQFQPDVVWTHQANSYSFYAVKSLRRHYPIALTVWGSDILVAPQSSKSVRKMAKYILKHVKIIAADSIYLANETKKLISNKNTPIHICQFGMNPLTVDLTKEAIFYSNRGHHKLYRIPTIIRAFHRFENTHPTHPWKLIIAGASEHTSTYRTLVHALSLQEKVEFVGFLSAEENAKWYGKARYFISIPESDGTAVSLLEAMYYNCTPIVSDLPANREWISHLENGYIVEDVETDFLTAAVQATFESATTDNRARIENDGTAEASCRQIQTLLDELTKK